MRTEESSHFWVGRFPSNDEVGRYFDETYDLDDEERERTPLSKFASDQGVMWYDHDCLEYGFEEGCASVPELIADYSYSEQWGKEVARRAAAEGFAAVNTVVFITENQIEAPRSIVGDGYELHYLGKITYRI